MQHVYWLGGSPCAGKTTIAHLIAQETDWQIYHIDRMVESYLKRATEQQPTLMRYREDGLKQFLSLSIEDQLSGVKAISHEQFSFILDDLAEMPSDTPILVEGANLLPADVAHHLPDTHHAIWMIPTEDFQYATYPNRGTWVQDVLRFHFELEERVDVFDRWMQRDAMYASWVAQQARDHGIPVIVVDGALTILDHAEMVLRHFGLSVDF